MSSISRSSVQEIRQPAITSASTSKPTGRAETPQAMAAINEDLRKNINLILERAGYVRRPDGSVVVKDATAIAKAQKAGGTTAPSSAKNIYAGAIEKLPPPSPPKVALPSAVRANAANFVANLDSAMNNYLTRGTDANGVPVPADISQMSPDYMICAFLKVQVSDPSNNPKTHDELCELASNLRQAALKEADAKMQKAIAQLGQAQQAADHASALQVVSTVVAIVAVVVLAVLSFFTAGATATLIPFVIKAAIALTVFGVCVAKAEADKAASDALSTAHSTDVGAKSAENLAQKFQATIKRESDIMNMLIESKSATVDAVMKMINASHNRTLNLQAAAMSRG